MIFDTLNIRYNNIKGREAPFYIVIFQIQFMKIPILEFIHVFSISDFENYYKNRFLFLFSILIKLFDHEIVNCEIILKKIPTKVENFLNFFQSCNKKFFKNLHFLKFHKGPPFEKNLR